MFRSKLTRLRFAPFFFFLRDREIEILTEKQDELRRDLRALKADYVNADADDVIRALRKSLRGLNDQVHKQAFSSTFGPLEILRKA